MSLICGKNILHAKLMNKSTQVQLPLLEVPEVLDF